MMTNKEKILMAFTELKLFKKEISAHHKEIESCRASIKFWKRKIENLSHGLSQNEVIEILYFRRRLYNEKTTEI